jgi:hypothetical protein
MEKYVRNCSINPQGKYLIGRPNPRLQRGYLNAHERFGACLLRLKNNPINGLAPMNTVMNIVDPLNEI